MNFLLVIMGLIIVAFTSIILINALPTLNTVTQTGNGTTWENSSTYTRTTVDFTNQFIILLPFLFLFIGLGLVAAGAVEK